MTPIKDITAGARTARLPGHDLLQAMFCLVFGLAVLSVHVALVTGFGPPALVWYLSVSLVVLLVNRDYAFALLLASLFLQNAFIALAAPHIVTSNPFRMLQATSVLSIFLTGALCVPAWARSRKTLPPESMALLRPMLGVFIVVAAYTLIGAIKAPMPSVLLYVRFYIAGVLMLAIGIVFGARMRTSFATNMIRVLAVALVAWGLVEFFFPRWMYDVFNFADYLRLKYVNSGEGESFSSVSDAISYSSRSYLNLSGMMGLDITLLRPNGPNFHPITYAYCTAFCCLMSFVYRNYILAVAAFILLVLIGAKGPLIIALGTLMLYGYYVATRKARLLMTALVLAMGAYVALGVAYGVMTRDYHVIGLIGGMKGFLGNPLGHGIGVGGNLSSDLQKATLTDFQAFQNFGADFGFESSIGVMIYQLGIAAAVFLLFCRRVWTAVWNAALSFRDEPRLMIVPIALLFVFTNGFFQEEAFSPAGWGVWLLVGGLLIARRWKEKGSATVAGAAAA